MTKGCAILLSAGVTAAASGHVTAGALEQFSSAVQASRPPDACLSLTSVTPVGTRTAVVQAGAFLQPGPSGAADPQPRAIDVSRTFCRVSLTLRPSDDSEINVELWLPADGWNRKFQAVGNGAFTGSINYTAMAAALRRGYAVASTDTGHAGGGARWALGHPEKVIDFGWRAVHEMVVASKRIVAAYYQAPPRFAYWNGCSAGGRQGMKEAQRFPEDFDGVIAGAPGLDWTGRAAQANRVAKVLESNSAARLSETDRQLLHRAVLDACDAIDGLKDGLLESPTRCAFDPAALECRSPQTAGCLTPAQVETARMIYSSAANPKTRRLIPGLARGSELGWTDLGWTASARATGLDQFRFLVFRDPDWTLQRFDFERDIVLAEDRDADTINALDPDLGPFIRRGRKLIHYHGWSDPQISPLISVQYYARMVSALGIDRVNSAHRLYMAPGMGHCSGGAGPNSFDMLGALEQWVESGKAPDTIIASHAAAAVVDRTRPLCPYPQVAVYSGSGSPDDAKNFGCRALDEAGARH
jgi:Tannase and feruloyl esterase